MGAFFLARMHGPKNCAPYGLLLLSLANCHSRKWRLMTAFTKKNWEVLIEIEGIEALSGPVRDSFIWLWSRLHFLQWLLNVVVSLCQLSQFWFPTDHWPTQRVYQRKTMLQSSLHCLQIACLAHQSFFKRTTDDSGFQGHNVELTLTCVFINFKVISSQPAMSAV